MRSLVLGLSILSLSVLTIADEPIENVKEKIVTRTADEGFSKSVTFKNPVFVTVTETVQEYGPDESCGYTGGDTQCSTQYVTECNNESVYRCRQVPRERCQTEYENQCRTVPGEQICRDVPRQHCENRYERECVNIPGRQVCQNQPRQVCETVSEWRCPPGVSPGGPGCREVKEQRCRTENQQVCSTEPPRQECRDVPRQHCETRYERDCHTGPSRQECSSVPVNRCSTYFEQECGNEYEEVCKQVPREQCYTTPVEMKSCYHDELVTREKFSHYDPDTIWRLEFSADAILNSNQTEKFKVFKNGKVEVIQSPFEYDVEKREGVIHLKKKKITVTDSQALTVVASSISGDYSLNTTSLIRKYDTESLVEILVQFTEGGQVLAQRSIAITKTEEKFSLVKIAKAASLPAQRFVNVEILGTVQKTDVHAGFSKKSLAQIRDISLMGDKFVTKDDINNLEPVVLSQAKRQLRSLLFTVDSPRMKVLAPGTQLVVEYVIERRGLLGLGGWSTEVADRRTANVNTMTFEVPVSLGRKRVTLKAGLLINGSIQFQEKLLDQSIFN